MSLKLLVWLAIIAVAIFGLDRLLLAMESRGWIYYRRKKPGSSALGRACLEVQRLLEPSKKYVIQIKEERKEQQQAGDLPPVEDNQEGGQEEGQQDDRDDGQEDGKEGRDIPG
ncbi:MAG: hypothetical protein QME85_00610 [Candidatus Saccharicenans sp.]|nr:hypothetical protein [Candidatus Saccharicenans sp.]